MARFHVPQLSTMESLESFEVFMWGRSTLHRKIVKVLERINEEVTDSDGCVVPTIWLPLIKKLKNDKLLVVGNIEENDNNTSTVLAVLTKYGHDYLKFDKL